LSVSKPDLKKEMVDVKRGDLLSKTRVSEKKEEIREH